MDRKTRLSRFILISFVAIAGLFIWSGLLANPAASQAQSQINALQVDIRGIESRLNRVEAQLSQLRGVSAPQTTPTTPTPQASTPQNREQMFDRLATLIVELKQQVNKLETRVTTLEKSAS